MFVENFTSNRPSVTLVVPVAVVLGSGAISNAKVPLAPTASIDVTVTEPIPIPGDDVQVAPGLEVSL